MAAIIVERACGCFRNSDFEQETNFDTIDEEIRWYVYNYEWRFLSQTQIQNWICRWKCND